MQSIALFFIYARKNVFNVNRVTFGVVELVVEVGVVVVVKANQTNATKFNDPVIMP